MLHNIIINNHWWWWWWLIWLCDSSLVVFLLCGLISLSPVALSSRVRLSCPSPQKNNTHPISSRRRGRGWGGATRRRGANAADCIVCCLLLDACPVLPSQSDTTNTAPPNTQGFTEHQVTVSFLTLVHFFTLYLFLYLSLTHITSLKNIKMKIWWNYTLFFNSWLIHFFLSLGLVLLQPPFVGLRTERTQGSSYSRNAPPPCLKSLKI